MFSSWSLDGSTPKLETNLQWTLLFIHKHFESQTRSLCVFKDTWSVPGDTRSWLHNKQFLKADSDDHWRLTSTHHMFSLWKNLSRSTSLLQSSQTSSEPYGMFQTFSVHHMWRRSYLKTDFILNWSHEPSLMCHMEVTLIANKISIKEASNGHTKSHQLNCFLIPSQWSPTHFPQLKGDGEKWSSTLAHKNFFFHFIFHAASHEKFH